MACQLETLLKRRLQDGEGGKAACRRRKADYSPADLLQSSALFRQLDKATQVALIAPHVCWKGCVAVHGELGDFWNVLKTNFSMQMADELSRGDAVLECAT